MAYPTNPIYKLFKDGISGQVSSVLTQSGLEHRDLVMDENPDKLEAKQGKLIPVLVKAIQELSAKVDKLENGS